MKKLLFVSICFCFLLSACTKPGFGGELTIAGDVLHHSTPIPDAAIMLAFGAKEFPGTDANSYDHLLTADSTGAYSLEGLEKGQYYIYATGYDANIAETVSGGIPFKIKGNGTIEVNIPVTEGH